jgi:hypothetical protein
MDLAAAGDDSDRTRDVAGVEVTGEHVPDAGQPFRREATAGHSLLLTLVPVFVRYDGGGDRRSDETPGGSLTSRQARQKSHPA